MLLDDDERSMLRIPTTNGVTLEFEKDFPYGPDDPYIGGALVRVTGDYVRLEQQVILAVPGELSAFLRSLYDEFRGWSGERTWRSLEDELRVAARHDGHVHLRWEVSSRSYAGALWTFSTTTHHEAGEDMRRLADAFEMLLGP